MLKDLKKKFILTNMLLVGTVLLVVFITICSNAYSFQMEEIDRTLKVPIGKEKEIEREKFGFMTSVVVVLDENNNMSKVIARGANITESDLSSLIDQVLDEEDDKGKIKDYSLFYEKRGMDDGGQIITFVDSSRMETVVERTLILSVISFILAMIFIFFISRFIANLAIKPVQKSWEQQKRFVADASHELKTPLTVILANNQILKGKKNAIIGDESQWIDSTLDEAKHMKKLVEDMLFLAKNDAVELKGEINNIGLSELIESDILQFEPVAYEGNVELASKVDPDISMVADRKQIKQLMHILLDNGIKYAQRLNEGELAKVEVELKGGQNISLVVRNTGEVVPQEQQNHMFDRFYRGDNARTRLTVTGDIDSSSEELGGGYGLGLAIAKTIVENHKGTIAVRSDESAGPYGTKGTAFTVTFKSHN